MSCQSFQVHLLGFCRNDFPFLRQFWDIPIDDSLPTVWDIDPAIAEFRRHADRITGQAQVGLIATFPREAINGKRFRKAALQVLSTADSTADSTVIGIPVTSAGAPTLIDYEHDRGCPDVQLTPKRAQLLERFRASLEVLHSPAWAGAELYSAEKIYREATEKVL